MQDTKIYVFWLENLHPWVKHLGFNSKSLVYKMIQLLSTFLCELLKSNFPKELFFIKSGQHNNFEIDDLSMSNPTV